MRKIINILSVISLLLFVCSNGTKKNEDSYVVAFVKEVYVDEGNYMHNDIDDSTYIKGDGERIESFIGVFPEKQDTISVYKLNQNLSEKPEKFSFWSKKKNNHSITFYTSMGDDIKITFSDLNNIFVNNDVYQVNKEYYNFLKQKILIEKSVLDLVFFLKDGYGDYEEFLKLLNKNWRNQKEDNRFKIIKAKIKNKNYQTDNQYFTYDLTYKYNMNGLLENVLGENSFNKKIIDENNKYIVYAINRSINERASENEYLYQNKKTLFDSIVGNRVQNSTATVYYYIKYQSQLQTKIKYNKPKNIQEIIEFLKIH
ncbi:hypothetical protein [Flavobacterium sp. ACN6]|uniref:hypothetical protein n=1 Tax=Flavobacterium sp. ACN6 TaxID=1920426 RepID=UPI000BB3411A|nr:hypothetical protein [Flavobacterium sp. ACN6]PBJ13330.1 hypothetical protein BSF42_17300 [Flavobacterium sp. ACN6]